MRRDLLEWPKALVLAETMNPKEIPYLSKEYAQELELTLVQAIFWYMKKIANICLIH